LLTSQGCIVVIRLNKTLCGVV